MKKLVFILVLLMGALVVNAQAGKATAKNQPMKMVVKIADLPKALTDNVAKDYPGFTIKEATSVTANNNLTYDVVITKGTTTETLVYDKDGKFIRKMTQKVVTTPAPAKK